MKKKKESAQVVVEDCNIIMQYTSPDNENIIIAKHKVYKKYYLGFRADQTMPYSMIDIGSKFSTEPYFKAIEAINIGEVKLTKVNGL